MNRVRVKTVEVSRRERATFRQAVNRCLRGMRARPIPSEPAFTLRLPDTLGPVF